MPKVIFITLKSMTVSKSHSNNIHTSSKNFPKYKWRCSKFWPVKYAHFQFETFYIFELHDLKFLLWLGSISCVIQYGKTRSYQEIVLTYDKKKQMHITLKSSVRCQYLGSTDTKELFELKKVKVSRFPQFKKSKENHIRGQNTA